VIALFYVLPTSAVTRPRPRQLARASGTRAPRLRAGVSLPMATMIVTDGSCLFFVRAMPLGRSRSPFPPSSHSNFRPHARRGVLSNNCPNLSAHTTTWVQCMGWLVDWARSRCSRSTFVTDGLVDAPTRARHISPENAARGHPTPFSWVLYVTDTTSTSFGARRQLSARSTFSAVGADLGYGHMGGRRRPRRKRARAVE